jgi:hypothetical protein
MGSPMSPADSDAEILSRLIGPEVENLPAEVARYLLSLDFCQSRRTVVHGSHSSDSSCLRQHSLGLGQPQCHLHGPI